MIQRKQITKTRDTAGQLKAACQQIYARSPKFIFYTAISTASIPITMLSYLLITKSTEVILSSVSLRHLNPDNILGKSIGVLCIVSAAYYTLMIVIQQRKKHTNHQQTISFSRVMLLSITIVLIWFLTFSLSIIVLRDMSAAFITSLFIPTLIVTTSNEPKIVPWDRVIRGFKLEQPKPKNPDEVDHRLIPWGNDFIEKAQETLGFFVLGNRGSGKTTWLEVIMTKAFKDIGVVPGHRAMVIDSKPDQSSGMIPFIEATGAKPTIFNTNDERRVGWDINKDVKTSADAMELAAILIQESDNQNDNEYFIKSARLLVQSAIEVLMKVKEDTFTYRDIILACTNKKDLEGLLILHHPLAEIYLEYLAEGKSKRNDVITTIASQLLPLSTIAARWEEAEERFSVDGWLKDGGSVLTLGADPAYPEFLKKTNHLLFRFLTAKLMGLDDDRNRRIWIVVDELAKVSPLPELVNLLTLARSKGVCSVLATQNIEMLIKRIGKEDTEAVLGLSGSKAIFPCDPTTAEFMSNYINKYEWLQPTYNKSTDSSGVSEAITTRPTITAQQLMDSNSLPNGPENGLGGYFTPAYKGIHHHRYSWDEIESMRVKRVDHVTAYDRADSTTLKQLKPWSDEERAELGLPPAKKHKK